MSVDLRTRVDGPVEPLDPEVFFADVLPAALDAHGAELAEPLRLIDPRPLVVRVEGRSWSVVWDGASVLVSPGTIDGDRVAEVVLDADQLGELVDDRLTFMALFSGGALVQPRGKLGHLLDWWLVLRSVLDDQTLYVPGSLELLDDDGRPLDLHRSFAPDDDRDEMRRFLEQAGYLHITGLFAPDEMAAISADMDRLAPTYSKGDGRSWWARTADGADRVVRMQSFDRVSEATASLVDDDRFLSLASLPGDGHQFGARRAQNRIEALFKPIGVVEGISDVPWHKDCSLGRHSYECCSMTVGISVTGADAASGQLRVVAGSHRALVWPSFIGTTNDLPQVDLPTSTGDVTVHLSCTLHMAQPPIDRERRVMYTGFSLPVPDHALEAARASRGRLGRVREAAPVSVSQTPGHTG